jgi:hypothetical protein
VLQRGKAIFFRNITKLSGQSPECFMIDPVGFQPFRESVGSSHDWTSSGDFLETCLILLG